MKNTRFITVMTICGLAFFSAAAFSLESADGLMALKRIEYKPQQLKQVSYAKAADSSVKIDGEIFFYFQKYLTQTSTVSYNKFDISRAYINFKKDLSEGAAVRLTLDASRLNQATDPQSKGQSLLDFLKYAYFDLPLLNNQNLTISTKMGLQQTAWIQWVEKAWNNRYIAKVFTDDEELMPSADFGIGFQGVLKAVNTEYCMTLTNGSGYKDQETTAGKDVSLRLNKDVFSDQQRGSVSLGGYVVLSDRFSAYSDEIRYGGLLGYRSASKTNIYAEYAGGKKSGKDISGCSVAGSVYFVPEVSLIGRYDYFKPDISAANNEVQKTIAGLSFELIKEIRLAIDVQSTQTGASAPERAIYLNSEIKY